MDVCLSSHDKILGYISNNDNFIPLNSISIQSHKHIFWCTRNKYKPNFYMLQQMLKNSIRDGLTAQPGEIVFNTMRYIEVVKKFKDLDTVRAMSVI